MLRRTGAALFRRNSALFENLSVEVLARCFRVRRVYVDARSNKVSLLVGMSHSRRAQRLGSIPGAASTLPYQKPFVIWE
jgi:hypothetical protein